MKIVTDTLSRKLLLVALFFLSLAGYGQASFNVYLANGSNPTPNTLEVDVMLDVLTPAAGVRLSSVSFGINYNPAILNGGQPCSALGCGSWAMIPGTRTPIIAGLNQTSNTTRNTPGYGHLRAVMTNLTGPTAIDIPVGTYRIGRYRFTNTAAPGAPTDTPVPFLLNSDANLWISPSNAGGHTNTIIVYYPFGAATPQSAATSTSGVTIPNSSTNTFSIPLNHCATSAATTVTPTGVTCFGDTDGSAVIKMLPLPSSTTVSYVLDSNPSVGPITLNAAGEFTITNLAAGSHTITITGSGVCTTPVVKTFTVSTPAQLTNTTTIANCVSYTWSVTGLTYTTSGTYTGTTATTPCATLETLNLTINPNTTGTTTAVACDSYTWAAPLGNGLTYTASTTVTHTNTTGTCPHTETLNLTITKVDNGNLQSPQTASICQGQTFTAFGRVTEPGITDAAGQGAGLDVEFGLSTAGGTQDPTTWTNWVPATYNTASTGASDEYQITTGAALAAGTYYYTFRYRYTGCPNWQYGGYPSAFWNGTTENSGTLTVNPLTTNGSVTTTECDSYTWPANGVTYTSSQTNLTHTVGCNTATLNLTINNSTSHTTTAVACDSYTWAAPLGNGLTYTTSQTGITFNSLNANNCQHVETLNLTITKVDRGNLQSPQTANICQGQAFTALGRVFEPGITDINTNGQGTGLDVEFGLSAAGGTQDPTTWTNWTSANYNPTSTCYPCNEDEYRITTGGTLTPGTYYYTFRYRYTGCPTWQYGGYPSDFWNGTSQNSGTLTVNPLTTNGSVTTTECGSYTWPANGVTYTSNQTNLTFTSGCNTATLNLTINNNSSGVTNAQACNSYTWAGPLGNGQTYTTSQSNVTHTTINGNGCTHTQTLNLVISTPTTGTTTASACNSYTWAGPLGNGQTYTSSQTGVVHVSNLPNGCQNTQTLNLTINNDTAATSNVNACDSYTWAAPLGNGQTYTSSISGVTHVSTNANGCQHTQTLNLTLNNSTSGVDNVIACDTYTWALPLGNGQTYNSSVTGLNYVTTNASGCPHTQTLNLTMNFSTLGYTNETACGSYTWAAPLGNGQTYTSSVSGVTHTSTNAAGCVHTEMLNLTINNNTTGTTTANACDSYTWALPFGNGQTYTSSVTGITHVSTNAFGCAHTQTLNLTINNSTSATTTATACDSYTWAAPLGNGQTYTSSVFGITKVTTNANGCPHTQTLNLTINNSTSATTTASSCGSYTWAGPLGNGQTYTTSQNGIVHVTTNAAGCSHTQTLNLTVGSPSSGTSNITACNSYTWAGPLGDGQTYTVSGTYTHNSTNASGCPHVQTLNLVVGQNTTFGSVTTTAVNTYTWPANGQTYTASGTYTYVTTNSTGCTNTATLNLTINIVTGTTWYEDLDGDGFGNPAVFVIAPTAPAGYVGIGTDCNDLDPTINPGAIEICYDGIDNDCNGVIDNVGQPGGCIAIVTSLMPTSCGATLATLRDKLYAHYVVGAQGYRFRIRNIATNVVTIRDRGVNNIALSDLPGITFNTTYSIDIALMIGNVWQPYYGTACNVTTPTPTSTIGAHCGTVLVSMNQWVYATYNTDAIGYRFRVTNLTDGTVQIKDQVLNRFNFNQLPTRMPNTIYSVEVALRNVDGTYLPYGSLCNITTGAARSVVGTLTESEFKVIAYPNPYAESFKLDIRTSSDGAVQLKVYDMLGKQIENRTVTLSEMLTLEIGANYPSGVYNLIVSQQDTTQTVRVIKR